MIFLLASWEFDLQLFVNLLHTNGQWKYDCLWICYIPFEIVCLWICYIPMRVPSIYDCFWICYINESLIWICLWICYTPMANESTIVYEFVTSIIGFAIVCEFVTFHLRLFVCEFVTYQWEFLRYMIVSEFVTSMRVWFEFVCEFVTHQWPMKVLLFYCLWICYIDNRICNCLWICYTQMRVWFLIVYELATSIIVRFAIVCEFVTHKWEFGF
jgi:hypothetical protein